MPNVKHLLEAYKAPQLWAVEQRNCILWSDGAPSNTFEIIALISEETLGAQINQYVHILLDSEGFACFISLSLSLSLSIARVAHELC